LLEVTGAPVSRSSRATASATRRLVHETKIASTADVAAKRSAAASIEATEMQIGQMCDCAQWGSLFVEPGQGSGAVDLQCVYVRFRACEEIRRPLDWSWPAKAGRPVITDARW